MRPTPILLAFQVFRPLDLGLAHDAVSKNVLHRTDENEIRIAAQVSADRSFATDDGHTAVAAAHRGSHDARRGDIDQLKVEIVFRIEPRFLGEPRHAPWRCSARIEDRQVSRRATRVSQSVEWRRSRPTLGTKNRVMMHLLINNSPCPRSLSVITTTASMRTTLTRVGRRILGCVRIGV